MSRLLTLLAVPALALAVGGCASTYTAIHKVDDNNYYITRIKANRSTVYLCGPIGQSADLRCVEIASPE